MENIDPSDMMISADTIKAIHQTALDQLVDSRDTNRKALSDSETAREINMITHAQQVVFTSGLDAEDGVTNIHVLTHPYVTCHVLHVATHNIHLQIANILHYLNLSRRIL